MCTKPYDMYHLVWTCLKIKLKFKHSECEQVFQKHGGKKSMDNKLLFSDQRSLLLI